MLALVETLKIDDARVLLVAIEGISNVLQAGKEHFSRGEENPFALELETNGGVDRLEEL